MIAADPRLVPIVSPAGKVQLQTRPRIKTIESLQSKTIVLLDNTKANSDHLLDEVEAQLRREGAEIIRRIKFTAGKPANEAVVKEAARADGFVTGVGD